MGARHRGRKALLQVRFAAEVNGRTLPENMESMKQLLSQEDLGIGTPLEMEEWIWIGELARIIHKNREEIDERITDVLENWTLERLSIVTRLILEQALAEMDYNEPSLPAPVAINESVELAREFDAEETAAFVNGVLDRLTEQ